MGLFSKRKPLPPTPEEHEGLWRRPQLLQHWSTIPEHMMLQALSTATDDQLRVLGWDLPSPHERFLAIMEAKQRRDRPDLYRKIQEQGQLSPDEFRQWTAPLQEMHGRGLSGRAVDQKYEEVFGTVE